MRWCNAPVEEITETLALLPKMYQHPAFPFDMKFNFEMLALQVERLLEATEEAGK